MDETDITLKTFKCIRPVMILACCTGWFICCWKVEETRTISVCVRTAITALHPETISSPWFWKKNYTVAPEQRSSWQGNFVRPRVFPSAKTPRTIAKGPPLRYSRFIFHRIFKITRTIIDNSFGECQLQNSTRFHWLLIYWTPQLIVHIIGSAGV